MSKSICVVTGSRAEYGLFYPVLRKIQASEYLKLQIIATTMHLSEDFGLTYKQIEFDGFHIDEKIDNLLASNSKAAITKSTGLAIILLSDAYSRLKPDAVLLLGDRFETHAAATAAMLMNIPIAHIHGGETSEGAVDEQIRHAITKMSYLHFTSTEEYRQRVIQMGESPERVLYTGAPGIDNILHGALLGKRELEEAIQWSFSEPTALITIHSETLVDVDLEVQIKAFLAEIAKSKLNVLFTYANADDGGKVINREIEAFVAQNKMKYKVEKSLGQLKYLSAIKYVDVLVGNTSSGIIEAASFKKPVVNVGGRQQGRLQSGNVINCEVDDVSEAISTALSSEFIERCLSIENRYGNGTAAGKIVSELESHQLKNIKRFHNL